LATDVILFIQQLAAACREVLKKQETVVSLQQPVKIYGDIHGQFFDLLSQFRVFGFPSCPDGDVDLVSYIFNGDFVDHGPHQLEVVVLLFALKIVYVPCFSLLQAVVNTDVSLFCLGILEEFI
jgi:hypothetical protein